MRIKYQMAGLERTTENVYVDWPDGVCWLVANEYGVCGAIIVHEDEGFGHVYELAVDEIAHSIDTDAFEPEEIEDMIEDGQATYRGGEPSNPNRSGILADTGWLTVFRHDRS